MSETVSARKRVQELAHAANEWLKAEKAATSLEMDDDMYESVMAKKDNALQQAALQVIEALSE